MTPAAAPMDDADGWVALEVIAPPEGRVVAARLGEHAFAVCRAGGILYALADRCSHAEVALSSGRLTGCLLECPRHGSRFDVRNGTPQQPPARRPVPTFEVRERDGRIEVRLPAREQQ